MDNAAQSLAPRCPSHSNHAVDTRGAAWLAGLRCAWSTASARFNRLPERRYGIVEFAAFLFLAVPLIPFFVGFTRPLIAVPAVLTIAAILYRSRPSLSLVILPGLGQAAACAVIAALFLWACAYLPPFGRSWDWLKHFALINELARYPWPPVNEETHSYLRYALGYYMVPGLVVGLFGDRVSVPIVFLETWAGLFLVLLLLLQKIRPLRPAPFLIVFLLFGGLDLIGWMLVGHQDTILATKEWWAGPFAYEGHATLFLNVPQHALAGMLGTLLLISDDGRPAAPHAMGLLGVAVMFWSPFVFLGLLPFALVVSSRAWRDVFVDWGNILGALIPGIPMAAYLFADTGGIPRGFSWHEPAFSLAMYAVFLLLEAGLYLIALWFCGWRHLRHPVVVVVVLLLLPLYHAGLYNDFVMRTCIPAVMLLAIAVAAGATETVGTRWIPLAILVAVGCAGSIIEIVGRGNDGSVRARAQSMRTGFLITDRPFFVQYNAALPNWILRR